MRSYSVAIAALAIDAPLRWIDNTISQNHVDGIVSEQRGVARRISFPALMVLAVARELQTRIGSPITFAVATAHSMVHDPSGAEVRFGPITLSLDIQLIRRALEIRLAEAMESAPSPPRGRPSASR